MNDSWATVVGYPEGRLHDPRHSVESGGFHVDIRRLALLVLHWALGDRVGRATRRVHWANTEQLLRLGETHLTRIEGQLNVAVD